METLDSVQAIVFDAYGTLFNIASIDQRLEQHFGEKAGSIGATWRRKQLEYTWLRTLMGKYKDFFSLTKDALAYACLQQDVVLKSDVVGDLMEHYYKLNVYTEVPEALQKLGTSYKLAILSNANPELLERATTYNNIKIHLGAIFSVDPLRQFKPVSSIYQLPASHWELEKSEILFCSSNTWDVSGAKAAGLKVAWINRNNGQEEQLGYSPDIMVHDLLELASALK